MAETGFKRFLALWAAQTASMTAGGLTSFALGVWVFQRTGSATDFALMSVASMLPSIACLPIAGALADRWGYRRTLLVADIGCALVGAALVGAFAAGVVGIGVLFVLLALASLVTSLHWPAYTSATTALVGEERVARAASMMQFGYVGQQVLAPALAGAMLAATGIAGVLAVDVVSFVLAALVVVLLRLPPGREPPRGTSLRGELGQALREVRAHGLLALSVYVATTYLFGGFVVALSTPLVLSIATPVTVGIVLSVMGLGMIVGSVLSTMFVKKTGGRRRLLAFDVAMGLSMLMAGFAASPTLVAAAGFLFLFGLAGHMSEEQALWQVRVAGDLQGRAFALKRMLTLSSLPVSYAIAGPLADRIFEPLMAAGGPLAASVGGVIGVGRGRGMALLLMVAGVGKLLVVLIASRSRTLARLDEGA